MRLLIGRIVEGNKKKGWTGEEHLITGERISKGNLQTTLLKNPENSVVFVLEEAINGKKEIRGNILVEKQDDTAEFGLFAIDPDHQSRGFGGKLIATSQKYAKENFRCTFGCMWVLTVRADILGWYQKLGFTETGKTVNFPPSEPSTVGISIAGALHFKELRKTL